LSGARKPPPPPEDGRLLTRTLWGAVVAVAGAVVGLAGLLYFIGAVTLWLALRNKGYSTDAAIEHQTRGRLISLGLRDVGFVLLVAVVVVIAEVVVMGVPSFRSLAAKIRFRYAAGAAVLLLLAASLMSWRWLAFAIAASTLVLVVAMQLRFPARWRQLYWFALLVPATLTALAWMFGSTVRLPAVTTDPTSALPLLSFHSFKSQCLVSGKPAESSYARLDGRILWIAEGNNCRRRNALPYAEILTRFKSNCSVLYFGETGTFAYLGAIRNVTQSPGGRCNYDAGPIVELRRDTVRLRFLRAKGNLSFPVSQRLPIKAAEDALASFFDKISGSSE
jgi:hypothetical protein